MRKLVAMEENNPKVLVCEVVLCHSKVQCDKLKMNKVNSKETTKIT